MSLPEKINRLPNWSLNGDNRWADFIELSCLSNPDHEYSIEDLIDHYSDERPENVDRGEEEHSAKFDRLTARMEDYFTLIAFRADTLGEYYPFKLEGKTSIVLKENLETHHVFYFFLLFASNLWLFPHTTRYSLTHAFEDISCDILQLISSPLAKTHVFGTSRNNEDNLYTGNLGDRIQALASQLFALASPNLLRDPMYRVPAGDGGLDLVSYLQIDGMPFIPVSFGQCACSYEEWVDKQASIRPDIWKNRMINLSPYLQFMFVPFYYRIANGEFENVSVVTTSLIDRHRIFILARPPMLLRFADHPIYQVVREIIGLESIETMTR